MTRIMVRNRIESPSDAILITWWRLPLLRKVRLFLEREFIKIILLYSTFLGLFKILWVNLKLQFFLCECDLHGHGLGLLFFPLTESETLFLNISWGVLIFLTCQLIYLVLTCYCSSTKIDCVCLG